MSSITPHNIEARLEKVASEIQDPGHRATVMEYLHERRAKTYFQRRKTAPHAGAQAATRS